MIKGGDMEDCNKVAKLAEKYPVGADMDGLLV
jgi:hypothetical protein